MPQDRTVEDGGQTAEAPDDDGLQAVHLTLCRACRDGAGGECHTPGCSLWMNRAPDMPVREPEDPVEHDIAALDGLLDLLDGPTRP